MRFKIHLVLQVVLLLALNSIFDLKTSLLITAFHFIPSLDFIMLRINFRPELHRKLFHNIFIIILASSAAFFYLDTQVALLASLNLLMHIFMDMFTGPVRILYPFSNFGAKINL